MYARLLSFLIRERLALIRPNRNNTGKHWCRVVMDEATNKLIKELPFSSFSTLEISGNKWAGFGFKKYSTVDYPAFDLCHDKLAERFDLVVAEQIFEHLLWPYRAVRNVHEMMADGGYFLITTPFLMKVHDFPTDCTRWTETGLKHLLAEGGFPIEKITTGSWGNLECAVSNLNRWSIFGETVGQSLNNERDYPVVVWALARK